VRITIANRRGSDGQPVVLESSIAVSLLNSLLVEGVPIRHDCGGRALCGTCAVRVLEGWGGLSPIGEREALRLHEGGRPGDCRLACQARAARDVSIEIPAEGQGKEVEK